MTKEDKGAAIRGCHYLIAGDTWKPWFLVQESLNGALEYSGIMWEVSLAFTCLPLSPFA